MICQMKDCENEADMCPVLLMYARPTTTPARCQLSLRVCRAHMQTLTVEDVLSDKGFEQICDGFDQLGRQRPVRDLTQLAFEPWHGSMLQRQAAKKN